MKKDINYYLGDFGKLSKTQVAAARDAGYSESEIKNKRQNWYDKNKESFKFSDFGKGKPTARQLAFIKNNVPDFDEEQASELTYSYARKVIRELAKEVGTETEYLEYIAKQEAHDAERAKRRMKQSEPIKTGKYYDMTAPETIVEQNQLPEIDSSRFDEEDDDENKFTPEFFERIKKNLNSIAFTND